MLDCFGLTPVIGVEREFYCELEKSNVEEISKNLESNFPLFLSLVSESGEDQFEYILKHTSEIVKLVETDSAISSFFIENYRAVFAAKPYEQKPGSGLHIHIHLENENGENIFTKQGDSLSNELAFSISGLLNGIKIWHNAFFPTESSLIRLKNPDKMTPTTISWGANNRTTALRLPDSGTNLRRIEHRVSGADANLQEVINAIISSISQGLQQKIKPPPQIFGDARDHIYSCPMIL